MHEDHDDDVAACATITVQEPLHNKYDGGCEDVWFKGRGQPWKRKNKKFAGLTYITLDTSRGEVDWFVTIQRLDFSYRCRPFRVRVDSTSANILRALGSMHAY
jgi:hypothetical protein